MDLHPLILWMCFFVFVVELIIFWRRNVRNLSNKSFPYRILAVLIIVMLSTGMITSTSQARPFAAITVPTLNLGTAQSRTTGTTLNIITTAAVAAGDDIVVTVTTDKVVGDVSVTDSAGNTYTPYIDTLSPVSYIDLRTLVFVAFDVNALSAGQTITITHPSLATRAATASAFRGLAPSGAFDQSSTASAASSSPSSGSTPTTTQADELLIGVVGTRGPDGDSAGTWLNSFNAGPRLGTTGGGNAEQNVTVSMGYRIVNSTGSYTAAKTGITGRGWIAGIATFKMALGPEMDVRGNDNSISDGDTTPSTTDNTDFGNISLGNNTAVTYTIYNTGVADLNLGTITFSGANAADFSILSSPTSPVAASGNTNFQVQFTPSSVGTRSASISIVNNDDDENPYNFSIQGTGDAFATTTTITGDTPDPSESNQNVNVTVTVTGGSTAPTGTVDITGADSNCSITLSGGTGNCNVTFTSTGVKTLTATYSGDATHSTSNDTESHTVGNLPPQVVTNGVNSSIDTGDGVLAEGEVATVNISRLLITFSEQMDNVTAGDQVTSTANYLLLSEGSVAGFQTASCADAITTGVDGGDTQIALTTVSYNSSTFTATLYLATSLPDGIYRLYACGTATLRDLAGNALAGDGVTEGTDFIRNFQVQLDNDETDGGTETRANNLPATGFPLGTVTKLPPQPIERAYASTDLVLEIPKLNQKMKILGVPLIESNWDVTWLGNNAGWLDGSAFPTWAGNTVLTGHVWDAYNQPGPFADLKTLEYGDEVKVHAFGQIYTYEVQESKLVTSRNVSAVLQHEEYDWVTLLSCESYNPLTGNYLFRRMVRAVLVSVK